MIVCGRRTETVELQRTTRQFRQQSLTMLEPHELLILGALIAIPAGVIAAAVWLMRKK